MPRGRGADSVARKRGRAIYAFTKECAAIISNVRAFFERERDVGRSRALNNLVKRTSLATGANERTVMRVRSENHQSTRRPAGEPGRRASSRRVPAAERAWVREAIFTLFENRSVPTLDSTLLYLEAEGASGRSDATYPWSHITIFCCMQGMRFTFSRGPNHYDVAREKASIVAQRNQYLQRIQEYRDSGKTIFNTVETWANKNMAPTRTWNDGNLRARLNVPLGKGKRMINAHVGSRKTGMVDGASLVLAGQKATGDYHGEMNSNVWLRWLEAEVLPKIKGEVLVVDRAPYYLVLTDDTRPASSKLREAQLADWLEAHDTTSAAWAGTDWRVERSRAALKAKADQNRPAPRFLVQDLGRRFDATILISPEAHPELNPKEMVWVTVKVALRSSNTPFSLARLQQLVQREFERITPEVKGRYEDHAEKMENFYRAAAAAEDEMGSDLECSDLKIGIGSEDGSASDEEAMECLDRLTVV